MSTATATDATPAPKGGRKKLILILAAVGVVLALGGGATVYMLKKKAADAAAEAGAEEDGAQHVAKPRSRSKGEEAVPQFVPLDMFTVNLADRETERYAQVGITLQIDDPKVADQIKLFMPVIRNNILMAIADKTAADLATREGKAALAEKVKRETSKALGFEVEEEEEPEEEASTTKKKKKKRAPPPLPINNVHFSNFIIQ